MTSGCYPGCYYYTDSCFRKDCKQVNKEQRKEWDGLIVNLHSLKGEMTLSQYQETIVAADVYMRKLERELQNIKGSKKIASLLKVQGK